MLYNHVHKFVHLQPDNVTRMCDCGADNSRAVKDYYDLSCVPVSAVDPGPDYDALWSNDLVTWVQTGSAYYRYVRFVKKAVDTDTARHMIRQALKIAYPFGIWTANGAVPVEKLGYYDGLEVVADIMGWR